MTHPDPAALANQARTFARKLRRCSLKGTIATDAATLLDTLAAAILTLEEQRVAPGDEGTSPRPFKVGDRVRIARKFEGNVDGWWWIVEMDRTVGQVGTIRNTPKDAASTLYVVAFKDDACGWVYPIICLDLLPAEDAQ